MHPAFGEEAGGGVSVVEKTRPGAIVGFARDRDPFAPISELALFPRPAIGARIKALVRHRRGAVLVDERSVSNRSSENAALSA
jgi:hypothetical protein